MFVFNQENLDLLFRGLKTVYQDSYDKAKVYYDRIAMTVPSGTGEETYGWLGQFPNMREWIGPRIINGLSASSFSIKNRDYEMTVEIPRNAIADDKVGIFKPMVSHLGEVTRQHPDELVFGLLALASPPPATTGRISSTPTTRCSARTWPRSRLCRTSAAAPAHPGI